MPEVIEYASNAQIADEVLQQLQATGSRIHQVPRAATGLLYILDPHLAFEDEDSGKMVLVEITGSSPRVDLPLATIPIMRRFKSAAQPHEVLLLSFSPVPNLVRNALASSGIHIVQAEPGKDVVPELAAAIAAALA